MAERTCIVTREVCDPARLIRFVAGPDGSVVPDLKRKLPGRGVWVTASRNHVEQAVENALFARGLKTNVKADQKLPGRVEALLLETALGALGFARKAGQCLTGSGKTESAIRSGKVLSILHASDGAENGLLKIRQAARAAAGGDMTVPIWRVFTIEQTSLALGESHAIHAVLTEGGAARKCNTNIAALAAYRGTSGDDESDRFIDGLHWTEAPSRA